MSIVRVKGIVIKEVYTEEADKIITVFAKDRGKISAYAKGARRPKSRLIAGTQLLCFSDFILYKGNDIYNVSNTDLIESFYNIRNDIEKLTYTAYILSLINDVLQENQPLNRLLKLFLNTLHLLSNSEKSPELIIRIFELRMMVILGYSPIIEACALCGKECKGTIFSYKQCGVVCSHCAENDNSHIVISEGTARAMIHIIKSDMESLFSFNVSPKVLEELEIINKRYLKERLEREYNKLDFLSKI